MISPPYLRLLLVSTQHAAGTGYWASLLRERSVDILAFDIITGAKNTYHGDAKPFTQVRRGGEEVLSGLAGRALLLCYPPPDDPMAERCLELFKGDTVAYIGEFQVMLGCV